MQKFLGKKVRIPTAFFPNEPPPAAGFWVADVLRFADGNKTVVLHAEGDEKSFWRYISDLDGLKLHA